MFNPKGSNLLDEQLAVSGLEMQFLDKIVQGITGHNQAKRNNAAAKKNERKLRKHQKKVARKTNKYNKKRDAADQANYHLMRDYSHETNIKNWRHGKKLTDFAHAQQLRAFAKSNEIAQGQFDLNAQGASEAVERQQASVEDMFIQSQFEGETSLGALKDAYTEQAFNTREENTKLLGIQSKQRLGTASIQTQIDSLMTAGSLQKQASLVEGLLEEGKASLGQAGKSRTKAKQSAAAALQRGLVGLEAELTGKRKQAGIELAQLNAETSLAITGVGLNLEKINNAIVNAEDEAEFNNRVLAANMKSFINQTERNIDEIATKKKYADMNTQAQMMLEPEFPGYNLKPTQPPERIFIKSMKAIPGFTPTAARQSTWAPLINAAAGIATDVISMGMSGGGSSGGGVPYSGPNFAPMDSFTASDYSYTPQLYGSPWGN